MLDNRLQEWAAVRGYRAAVAPASLLKTIREKFERRREAGLIDRGFFAENLAGLMDPEGVATERERGVVVVAVPRPAHELDFSFGGRRIRGILPPTYVRYRGFFEDVLEELRAGVLGRAVEASILKGPLKSLAVHTGLASYGRNNVTYIPGLGSYYQLCGYVVDTGGEIGTTGAGGGRSAGVGEAAMDLCAKCRACVKACPTGAISDDRFLIKAEKCFTLHSEAPGSYPEGIAPAAASTCVIGCLECQLVCPANKGRLKLEHSGVAFTAEETDALLEEGRRQLGRGQKGKDSGPAGDAAADGGEGERSAAWQRVRAKAEPLGLTEDIGLIGRNLLFHNW